MRPSDPQLDLYELDLVEPKNLTDIERMLGEIDRILKRHPNDARVEERAIGMVGNVVPLMGNLCDQLTEQMSKVMHQVRNSGFASSAFSKVEDGIDLVAASTATEWAGDDLDRNGRVGR